LPHKREGIGTSVSPSPQPDMEPLLHVLNDTTLGPDMELYHLEGARKRHPMFRSGRLVLGYSGRTIHVDPVLIDSGAMHASYMSMDFYRAHEHDLRHFYKPAKGKVRLGGTSVVHDIYHEVHMPLELVDSQNVVYKHMVKFTVFDTKIPLIVGAPDLMKGFLHYFLTAFEEAALSSYPTYWHERAPKLCSVCSVDSNYWDSDLCVLTKDWMNDEVEIMPLPFLCGRDLTAPEEHGLGYPGDFIAELPNYDAQNLCFIAPTEEEKRKKFRDLLPTNVSDEFKSTPWYKKFLEYEDVFVPNNWDGINGIEPLVLELKEGAPSELNCKVRPVGKKLYEAAKDEATRLKSYFWRNSRSPWSCPLVIAPKATAPFIRICGDYTKINLWINKPNWPIPKPMHEVQKAAKFRYYADLDMTNGFHQLRLSKSASELLSVATPWGQFEPAFLPEGVRPASYYLHDTMVSIFTDRKDSKGVDIKDWIIVIFDNILVCADTMEELGDRLTLVLSICRERNVFLKMAKTSIGVMKVKFFGYEVLQGTYRLCQDRLDALSHIPCPTNLKEAQRVMGGFIFCSDFVLDYATLAAPCYEMVKNTFDWNADLTVYRESFEALKQAIVNSCSLHVPDYDLPWVLRVDASDLGVSGVLYQIIWIDGKEMKQVFATFSQKVSGAATRYGTIDKESLAIYLSVQAHSFYLMGKSFSIETDHNNLVYMNVSQNPRVIRHRTYLSMYEIEHVRHIRGIHNCTADMMSRAPMPSEHSLDFLESSDFSIPTEHLLDFLQVVIPDMLTEIDFEYALEHDLYNLSEEDMFKECHGGRIGHWAGPEVWRRMNERFPGHKVPYRTIDAMVRSCATCQKQRLNRRYFVDELVKTHKVDGHRKIVGADLLSISEDEEGFKNVIVITNFFSKRCRLFKTKDKTAESLARCFLIYITQHGLFDELRTDPGSDFTSELFDWLNKWLGIKHVFTLVDRPQGSNVEGTNKQVLRHLRALVFDEDLRKCWSQDHVLPIIEYIINTSYNREVGGVPLHIDMGNLDIIYTLLPENIVELPSKDSAKAYAEAVQSVLTTVREKTRLFHEKLDGKRRTPEPLDGQYNTYQPGDLVRVRDNRLMRTDKIADTTWLGPYKVVSHVGNDVLCKFLFRDREVSFHVSRLDLWVGT
jgi:hypothetical protein